MQFGVVAVPLVCDTLSVRVAEKGFKLPSSPAAIAAVACPPVARRGGSRMASRCFVRRVARS